MRNRGTLISTAAIVGLIVTSFFVRDPLGRSRPDLAAWFSFDGGPLTFSHAYASGRVGPFAIGDTRAAIVERLSSRTALIEGMPQIVENQRELTVSLPANSGGYVTYTITFGAHRAASIRTFYSVFSGL